MVFVVIYVCVVYNLYLNSSGTDINIRKTTVRSQQKVKRLKVSLSGDIFFEKIWVARVHHLCQSMNIRLKGGGSVSVMKREHLMNNREGGYE